MSVEPLLYKSYVAQIKNSPGTKMYQDFFALVNLEEKILQKMVIFLVRIMSQVF